MLPCEVLLLTPNSVEGVAFFPWVGVFDKFMSQGFFLYFILFFLIY